MFGNFKMLGALLAVCLGSSLVQGGPRVPPGVRYLPDLTYRTAGKTVLKLDLARPKKGAGPFPAVVCIHGGGWLRSSRKAHVPLILKLARDGYVAVTVSYRYATTKKFPAPVHDVKAAVRWLRANAARYRVDQRRIAALGYSSGGTLACLLGGTVPADGLEGKVAKAEPSSRVQAVVSYYGISDLGRLYQDCEGGKLPYFHRSLIKFALTIYLGGTPKKVGRRYTRASPITYARKGAAATLLIHGTKDQQVPWDQSRRFAARLKAAGARVQLLTLKGAPHDFTGKAEEKAYRATLKFLARQLRAGPGRPFGFFSFFLAAGQAPARMAVVSPRAMAAASGPKKKPARASDSPTFSVYSYRAPMSPPGEWELERYRPLLRLLARQLRLDPRLRRRFDSSDLVQDALLKAQENLGQCHAQTEAERVKWLQTLLAHAAIDAVRRAKAEKRNYALEKPLQDCLAESSARLEAYLAADQSSPGEQAERHEKLLRISAAVDQLPEDQKDVFIHRHLLGTPIAEIAEQLDRSEKAVADLLYRATRKLRQLLTNDS
jgi:RNA polymerase sigma-70 factor (subfamily 1)